MTDIEYIKRVKYLNFYGWRKIFLWLGISQVRLSGTSWGRNYQVRDFNPWNPLSYVVIIMLLAAGMLVIGIPAVVSELKGVFKWK